MHKILHLILKMSWIYDYNWCVMMWSLDSILIQGVVEWSDVVYRTVASRYVWQTTLLGCCYVSPEGIMLYVQFNSLIDRVPCSTCVNEGEWRKEGMREGFREGGREEREREREQSQLNSLFLRTYHMVYKCHSYSPYTFVALYSP